jgi:predicted N-acyltransferase
MNYTAKLLPSILDISADNWNSLADKYYPFLKYEFISALETSGCTSAKSGWQPIHLCIYQQSELIAIVPMYQKTNSNGEYVFDWDWANAYESHQLEYYPKLLTAIPFSPCYGPRIISKVSTDKLLPFITQYIKSLCTQYGFSGWHSLFNDKTITKQLAQQTLLTRTGIQYHWFNQNYHTFDDYLDSFTSRKRKNIKRERRIVSEQGVTMQIIEGAEISDKLLQEFYYCYQLTYLKRGRQGYLNIDFFKQLLLNLSQHIVLFVAIHENKTVACAWCFKNTDPDNSVLYGRYWGCLDNFDNLHFETCYYVGLEYCIAHKIDRFDPGAQGEHKIQRGFKPIFTYSSHYIAHPQFSEAIADFLTRETAAIEKHALQLNTLLPFKQPN